MASNDERVKRMAETGRESRAMQDRAVTENRELSGEDARRLEQFRSQFQQSALPNLPEIPGYHVCWVSTTNSRDTPRHRQGQGYEFVTEEDVAGWGFDNKKSADMPGAVSVNEMVAMKLPMHLYQAYMTIAHHDRPNEEEAGITELAEQIREEARKRGSRVQSFDGLESMQENQRRKAPVFT